MLKYKSKNHWWDHKLKAWEDYKTTRNIKSPKIWPYFQGATLTRNKHYYLPCHKPCKVNQGINVGGWPSINHEYKHIYP
jgi:hypothetical protein